MQHYQYTTEMKKIPWAKGILVIAQNIMGVLSEAILPQGLQGQDCFVGSLLAMTGALAMTMTFLIS